MMQVLIVEDDASIRDMLNECLADEGYAVALARHGQEALDLLRANALAPDLILLDLAMPVMDGWAFLAVQQADAALSAIPLIVFSADRGAQQGNLPPGVPTIAKPIDIDVLLDHVGSYRREP